MSETGGDILVGAFTIFGLNIVQMVLSVFFGTVTQTDFLIFGVFFVGLIQLVYVVPLYGIGESQAGK